MHARYNFCRLPAFFSKAANAAFFTCFKAAGNPYDLDNEEECRKAAEVVPCVHAAYADCTDEDWYHEVTKDAFPEMNEYLADHCPGNPLFKRTVIEEKKAAPSL